MIPENLSHKPIIGVDNYDRIDGHYANNTDARALSIGYAQFDNNEISVKVFRNTGTQWSPQTEELPLHRCIDLCTLIIKSLILLEQERYSFAGDIKPQICKEKEIKYFKQYYKQHYCVLLPKLRELQDALNTFIHDKYK